MIEQLRIFLWRGTVAACIAAVVLGNALGFSLSRQSVTIVVIGAPVIGLFATHEISAFGRSSRIAMLGECFLLFMLTSAIGAVLSYIAMVGSRGFTDDTLVAFDRMMAFDWLAAFAMVQSRPLLWLVLEKSYFACFSMPLIVLGILYYRRHEERMYRYLLAHAVGLLVTIVLFFFFPARAAFDFYQIDVSALPDNADHYSKIITGLRDGSLVVIQFENLGGIITFPSFHAAMAILFVWAIWPCKLMRVPLAVVNALMWLAAVPIGGHYAVDLLGGSLIALAAIAVAKCVVLPLCPTTKKALHFASAS